MVRSPWWMSGVQRVALARRTRAAVQASAPARETVDRFIAGEEPAHALAVALDRVDKGLDVTFAHVGPVAEGPEQARAVAANHAAMLDLAADAAVPALDLCVDLDQLGLRLGADGPGLAEGLLRDLAAHAERRGATLTLEMPTPDGPDRTDEVLALATSVREQHPWLGITLLASLRRTASDLSAVATPGSRVRLSKGAEPDEGGWDTLRQADRSYVRGLRALMESEAYPIVSTHDARMVSITHELVRRNGRTRDDYEFWMPLGVRPLEHRRLVDTGRRLRVYVPWGAQWHEYLVSRVLERPRLVGHLARQLLSRR